MNLDNIEIVLPVYIHIIYITTNANTYIHINTRAQFLRAGRFIITDRSINQPFSSKSSSSVVPFF